mmetsp:Transcript_10673/g.30621  ORF Transcript_10673/g.30621 Transcript_10673/m.30621 type:complete len:307 (-) Transcript_10673:683-1603(-)
MKWGASLMSSLTRFSAVLRSTISMNRCLEVEDRNSVSWGKGKLTYSMWPFQKTSTEPTRDRMTRLSVAWAFTSDDSPRSRSLAESRKDGINRSSVWMFCSATSPSTASPASSCRFSSGMSVRALTLWMYRVMTPEKVISMCHSTCSASTSWTSLSLRPSRAAARKATAFALTFILRRRSTRRSLLDSVKVDGMMFLMATRASLFTTKSWFPWQGPCMDSMMASSVETSISTPMFSIRFRRIGSSDWITSISTMILRRLMSAACMGWLRTRFWSLRLWPSMRLWTAIRVFRTRSYSSLCLTGTWTNS